MASSNSSKTAHVMNLLSKSRAPAAEAPAEPQAQAAPQAEPAPQAVPDAAPAPQAEPARTAPVAPIISSINADAAVSSQIKDALEAALEQEGSSPAPPVREAPAPVRDTSAPAGSPPVREELAPAFTEEDNEAHSGSFPEGETPAYVNVMQVLVEEKAERYAKMFGVCTCVHCMNDIKALALNHLPSKYVVMDEGERIPKLTFYEGQYSSDITAQLLRACEQVNRRPHHTR